MLKFTYQQKKKIKKKNKEKLRNKISFTKNELRMIHLLNESIIHDLNMHA
jgi:hypothetical protein